jgi:chorismate mutase
VNITREKLIEHRAELAAMQGATGFADTLPAEPQACPSDTLQRLYLHIRDQLREAIDPHGAELARAVDGRYEIIERIGEGNLASIYRAHDPVLDRAVVIKVLKDASQRQAFMNDVADAVRTSEEPNFMNVYDASREESTRKR